MARIQQTFENRKDGPIYISVEPWPHCFELEPGDKLTLIWNAPESGEAMYVSFLNERELVLYPESGVDDPEILLNGESAEGLSWSFKHR